VLQLLWFFGGILPIALRCGKPVEKKEKNTKKA
jgi:hypothetical protein